MARSIHNLADTKIRGKLAPKMHADGGGLYLKVSKEGAKSWVFVSVAKGKRTERGLGAYPAVSLKDAREAAAALRKLVAEGEALPLARAEPKPEQPRTFQAAAAKYLAWRSESFKSDKHKSQWHNTLRDYCGPIAAKNVADITTQDVVNILEPIWLDKYVTASRVRGRIETVLAYARSALKWLPPAHPNPASWKHNLDTLLPFRRNKNAAVKHHAAMQFEQVPEFLTALRAREALAALALEFLIYTAARSGEVLGALWSEIDLTKGVWSIPAERMKGGRAHNVPLSTQAIALLRTLQHLQESPFVFPGIRSRKKSHLLPPRPLSDMSMEMLMRRMEISNATPHGFRSSFRDWAGDATNYPREMAETALAHKVGDDTEAAYRRSDALEKRRKMMQDWADYLTRGADKLSATDSAGQTEKVEKKLNC